MKKVLLVLHFTFCILHYAVSQNPLVKMWDKTYGGSSGEEVSKIIETHDGNLLMGGCSASPASGTKTQNSKGGLDFWMVKCNSVGTQLWDIDLGGTDEDILTSLKETKDRGFILGGCSQSGINGDKTQATKGGRDFWVIKTDSLGNKIWDKDFGGTEWELLEAMVETNDGGYLVGGYSASGISGDKTEGNWDTSLATVDIWIVKLDSLGNKLWDKVYGGTGTELLVDIIQTNDGGFLLAGNSNSNVSGNKSSGVWGGLDFWLVRIDSLGNKIWDRNYGGNLNDYMGAIFQTPDDGFVLAGNSESGISGNKTQYTWSGSVDFWILKIDSSGNILLDNDFGGTLNEDELGSISQTFDGGFLITGTSYSPISGDKTENNLGPEQTWVMKTDSAWNIIWDKTLHTSGHDENGIGLQTFDRCFSIVNTTEGVSGDKTGWGWGYKDIWLIKFCDTTFQVGFTGSTFLCAGGCTDFINLSQNALLYQWYFPGATPDTSTAINPTNICYINPGAYDVQLIATNANGSDTLLLTNYITVFPSPPPQSITQSGDTLSAIAGANSYQWYYNGNIITGATNYFYVATQSGDYNVVATDTNGCEVEAVINNVAASIQYTLDSKQFTIYPNPATDQLIIKNEVPIAIGIRIGTAVTISIYNMLGELAVEPETRNYKPETVIDVSALSEGMYWIDISTEDKIFRAKFVKQ